MSGRVKPGMVPEPLQSKAQGFRPLLRRPVLERIALQKLKEMDMSRFMLWEILAVAGRFVLVDFSDKSIENVFGQRVGLTGLSQLHQVTDDKANLNFIGWVAVIKPLVVPDVDRSGIAQIEPEMTALEYVYKRPHRLAEIDRPYSGFPSAAEHVGNSPGHQDGLAAPGRRYNQYQRRRDERPVVEVESDQPAAGR